MCFVLRHMACFNGVVARVVWPWGDLIDDEAVVFQEEHFNAEDASAEEGSDSTAGKVLCFDEDAFGNQSRWSVDELADAVFMHSLDGWVGVSNIPPPVLRSGMFVRSGQFISAVLRRLDHHYSQFHFEICPFLHVQVP